MGWMTNFTQDVTGMLLLTTQDLLLRIRERYKIMKIMKKNSNDNTEASVKENFSNWTGALACLSRDKSK